MDGYIIHFAVAFTLLLLGYTFRSGITDILYAAQRNWKETSFIAFCIAAGMLMGVYTGVMNQVVQVPLPAVHAPVALLQGKDQNHELALIGECKSFVQAKLEHKAGYAEPTPPLTDVLKIGARSYWDSCAHAFGTNYWKYDISINGENGGQVLCRAYRQGTYRSGNVETWCNTVFAPGGRKV